MGGKHCNLLHVAYRAFNKFLIDFCQIVLRDLIADAEEESKIGVLRAVFFVRTQLSVIVSRVGNTDFDLRRCP